MDTQKSRYLKTYFSAGIGALLLVAAFNAFVDPLWVYHRPVLHQRFESDQRYQNPGLARHCEYDSVIIGTSHTENFLPSQIEEVLGWKTLRLSISGATAREQALILETAIKTGRVKRVLWSILFRAFQGDPERMRPSQQAFPFHLYEISAETHPRYLLSLNTLHSALNVHHGSKRWDLDTLGTWRQAFSFGESYVLASWTDRENAVQNDLLARSQFTEGVGPTSFDESVARHLVRIVKQNPQIDFYVLFPPLSILSSVDELKGDSSRFRSRLVFKDHVLQQLLRHDNCNVYDFETAFDVTHDLGNYKDLEHFSGEINDFMIKSIARDEFRVTPADYRERIAVFQHDVHRYAQQEFSPGGRFYGRLEFELPSLNVANAPESSPLR